VLDRAIDANPERTCCAPFKEVEDALCDRPVDRSPTGTQSFARCCREPELVIERPIDPCASASWVDAPPRGSPTRIWLVLRQADRGTRSPLVIQESASERQRLDDPCITDHSVAPVLRVPLALYRALARAVRMIAQQEFSDGVADSSSARDPEMVADAERGEPMSGVPHGALDVEVWPVASAREQSPA
jgi:hypothetical protein